METEPVDYLLELGRTMMDLNPAQQDVLGAFEQGVVHDEAIRTFVAVLVRLEQLYTATPDHSDWHWTYAHTAWRMHVDWLLAVQHLLAIPDEIVAPLRATGITNSPQLLDATWAPNNKWRDSRFARLPAYIRVDTVNRVQAFVREEQADLDLGDIVDEGLELWLQAYARE